MGTPLRRRQNRAEARVRSAPRVERRAIARYTTDFAAQVEWQGRVLDVLIANLGIGGLFVRSAVSPPYGEHVVVVTALDQRKLRLRAVVRWGDERGFGVQFDSPGALETASVLALASRNRKSASKS